MTLSISTDEFRAAAARLRVLCGQLEYWSLRASTEAVAAVQVSRVRRECDRLAQLATRLSHAAQAYDRGESQVITSVDALARASMSVAALVAPAMLTPLVLAGLAASNTTAGVALDRHLMAVVPVASLVGAGEAFGLVKRTGVEIAATSSNQCLAPNGYADMFSRIPRGQAQIRIERYSGAERYIVYIAGTRDFSWNSGSQPWDMSSNALALSATGVADSERAVREALAQAGVDARVPVTLVGHSQGGLIAARIASSQAFNVTDVLTAGAPIERLTLPASVRLTTVEHTDDVITALGAAAVAAAGAGVASAPATALRIREPFAPGAPTSELPAHRLTGYVQTARRMDANPDPLLRQRKAQLTFVPASAQCSATEYTATRPTPEHSR